MLPLDGLLVLDMSQFLAGPVAALRLADLGAKVIKIERPGSGELGRQLYISNLKLDGDSTLFHTINRNKQSLSVDLKDPNDLEKVRRLILKADVLIQNFRPGVIDRLGLGYEQVRALRPELVYASVTGYGNQGPWRDKPGQDLLAQALSGLLWLSGNREDPPTPFGLSVIDMFTGAHLTQGILSCLVRRGTTRQGGLVEVSLLESAIDMQFEVLTTFFSDGEQLPRRSITNNANAYLAAPYGIYRTSDGYLALAMTPVPQLAELLGMPELSQFSTPQSWFDHRDTIKQQLANKLVAHPSAYWLSILEPAGVWCADVFNWQRLVRHPAFDAIAMTQKLGAGTLRELQTTRCPIRIDGQRLTNPTTAPRVGQHTQEIVQQYQLEPKPQVRIGVVGLGVMGSPMATRLLQAGYHVKVFNRTPEKCRALEEQGAVAVATAKQLAAESDVLILMLADDAAVEQAIVGQQGILAGGQAGLVVINCSTVHPDTNRRLAGMLAARNIQMLDAPVTGSRPQAETGKLFFLVGGEVETYQSCIPLFETLGRGHIYLGPVGAGACAKLCNNLMGFINLAGLVEALQLVERFGLAPEKFLEVVANSGGRSVFSEIKGPKIMREDWSPDFALKLAAKDLRLAYNLVQQLHQKTPILERTSEIYAQAAEQFGENDVCSLKRWYNSPGKM